jgi:hypothetical protein
MDVPTFVAQVGGAEDIVRIFIFRKAKENGRFFAITFRTADAAARRLEAMKTIILRWRRGGGATRHEVEFSSKAFHSFDPRGKEAMQAGVTRFIKVSGVNGKPPRNHSNAKIGVVEEKETSLCGGPDGGE